MTRTSSPAQPKDRRRSFDPFKGAAQLSGLALHFREQGSISILEAWQAYGISNLRDRVEHLKYLGFYIVKRGKRYYMEGWMDRNPDIRGKYGARP